MKRREIITLLGGVTAGWPLAAEAQQGGQMRRIGVLMGGDKGDTQTEAGLVAFRSALKELGWTEG